jgi:hypothetical protein
MRKAIRRRYGHSGSKVNPHKAQDAFHYALAAAGGSAHGYESTFEVGGKHGSPSSYLRMARKEAREAGIKLPSQTKSEARELAKIIYNATADAGFDAYTSDTIAESSSWRGKLR